MDASVATKLLIGESDSDKAEALAEMLDGELWTADQRFYNSVSSSYPQIKLLETFNS